MPKITERLWETLQVPKGARDVFVWDDELAGFGIRKFASGKAFFVVKYVVNGRTRRQSLGECVSGTVTRRVGTEKGARPTSSLKVARSLASEVKAKARLGQDVVAERQAATAKEAGPTVADLIPRYLEVRRDGEDGMRQLRPSSLGYVRRYLEQVWRPLHGVRLDALTRADVKGRIEELARENGKVAADRARAAFSTFCAWCIEQDHGLAANPCIGVRDKSINGARDRVLSEGELAQVWRACADDSYGRIVRLLILTGCRREEIGQLAWPEVSVTKRQIELPARRTKNGRAHIIPLAPAAMALLPPTREGGDHVFGRDASSPFSGFSRAKEALDERIAIARRKAGQRPIEPWRLHDLRRSTATHLAEVIGVPPHIIELTLNHVSGTRAGIAGIYNRSELLSERRDALEKWARHIVKLAAGPSKKGLKMAKTGLTELV
jgi:integrase